METVVHVSLPEPVNAQQVGQVRGVIVVRSSFFAKSNFCCNWKRSTDLDQRYP